MLTPESKADLQQDWTAARCARLLRRISAPLNALRKLNAKTNSAAVQAKVVKASKSQPASRRSSEEAEGGNSDDEPKRPRRAGPDPDWIPAWSDKPSRTSSGQNYSKRRSTADTSAPKKVGTEQCVEFRTPQLQRIANRPANSTSPLETTPWKLIDQDLGRQNCQVRGALSKQFAPFVKSTDPRETHLSNLRRGIDDLLRATDLNPGTERPRIGCSSLLSTCLRRLPDFVKLEQEEQAGLAEDEQTDRPIELFNELEQQFATSSRGWRRLRVVVRAQGLSMLVDAASEKLIPWSMIENLVSNTIPIDPTFGTVIDRDVSCKPMSVVNTSTQAAEGTTFIRDLCQSYTALTALRYSLTSSGLKGTFLQHSQPRIFNHLEKLIAEGRLGLGLILAPSKSSFWRWVVSCISRTGSLGTSASRLLRTLLLTSSGHLGPVAGFRISLLASHLDNTLCAVSIKSLITIIKTLAGLALHPSPSSTESDRPSSSSDRARWLFSDTALRILSLYSNTNGTSPSQLAALSSRTKIVLTAILETSLMILAADGERAGGFSPRHADRISSLLTFMTKPKGASEYGNQSNFFIDALDIIRRIQGCDVSEVLHEISSRVIERRSTGFAFAQRTEERVSSLLQMAGVHLGMAIERPTTTLKSGYNGRLSFANPLICDGDEFHVTVAIDDLGTDPIGAPQPTLSQGHAGVELYESSDDESSSAEDTFDAPFSSHIDIAAPAFQSAETEQRGRHPHHIEECIQPHASPDEVESRQTQLGLKKIGAMASERQPLRPIDRSIPMSSRQKPKKRIIVDDKLPFKSKPLIGPHVHTEEYEDSGYSSASTISSFRERRKNHRKRTSNLFESVDRADSVGCSKKQRTSGGSRSSLGIAVTDFDDDSEDELSFCN